MKEHYCQSCGMDMVDSKEAYGTNQDGTISTEYCHYCYKDGKFQAGTSLEELIHHWTEHVTKEDPSLDKEETKQKFHNFLSGLNRWKQKA